MSVFFGNILTAEIIARIFYNADIETRAEIINLNPLEYNERDRVSVLCREIRRRVNRNPFIGSISIQAHARDTTQRDALFVFRYKDEVKIGIFEAKILRIREANNLTKIWDWVKIGTTLSHFTEQVINQQTWIPQAAVWNMFIPNCPVGAHSPSLERRGSSNIWSTDLFKHPNITSPTTLWNFQHILSATVQYLSIYDIVKAILRCEKGTALVIDNNSTLRVESARGINMDIPLPNARGTLTQRVNRFFDEFSNFGSYNYYSFDDLETFVTNFVQNNAIVIPNSIRNKKEFTIESQTDFMKIIKESLDHNQ